MITIAPPTSVRVLGRSSSASHTHNGPRRISRSVMRPTCAAGMWLSDEATRGGRDTQRHGDTRNTDGPERLQHPAAVDDSDISQQRGTREHRSTEDLGRSVKRELALQDARGRPGDCGERHVDLPTPLEPRPLERHRRRRHAVKR